jgi:hypothetical protein
VIRRSAWYFGAKITAFSKIGIVRLPTEEAAEAESGAIVVPAESPWQIFVATGQDLGRGFLSNWDTAVKLS